VSVTCPAGHQSETTDYCDQCGLPIPSAGPAGPAGPAPSAGVDAGEHEPDTAASAIRPPCPACGTAPSGDDRYCEACGHDLSAPVDAAAGGVGAGVWEAVVSADREQFERMGAEGLEFPDGRRERLIALDADEVRIGRPRQGDAPLEIELSGATRDPGASHLHAVLERQRDGSYVLRDLGSMNGTMVGDDPNPIGTGVRVALDDGDVIRLGAWTAITIRRRT
jgi:hypothetical protein